MIVLAKGYKGRPYTRQFVREAGSSLILANPDCDDAVRTTLSEGVGFPRDHVFEFDSALSESLHRAWDGKFKDDLETLWLRAKPAIVAELLQGE